MKILLIDDEPMSAEGIREDILSVPYVDECDIVETRDEAIERLDEQEYDLYVCDLELPAQLRDQDKSIQHGRRVYDHARAIAPGTPALFLTGNADFKDVRTELTARAAEPLFGTTDEFPMVHLVFKDEREVYMAHVGRLAEGLHELDESVSVSLIGGSDLSISELRLIRNFARRQGAAVVSAEQLSGLSGMRTLKLHLLDSSEFHRAWIFAKLGPSVDIQDEVKRHQSIAPRLGVGAYPALVFEVHAGGRKSSGLFYNLADDCVSAFAWLAENPQDGSILVANIRKFTDEWQHSKQTASESLGERRRRQITDDKLAPYFEALRGSPWERIEASVVEFAQTLQHGDLHGFNVLVRGDGTPILIDFGSAGDNISCLDPIILEMSILFHKDSPFQSQSWPTPAQCDNWADLPSFVANCPLGEFVTALRKWGFEVCEREEVYLAAAYCHSMRQLKYADTNKLRAIQISSAIARRLDIILK